jgi:hypothetical protein
MSHWHPISDGVPMTTSELVHDDHGHEHGQGCGHVAFQHADHVDYLHDGPRQAAHDDHYDHH